MVHKIKHYTTHRQKIRLTPITCWAFLHISEALVRCCSRLSQHHVSSTWRMYFCKTRLWFILFSSRFSFSFLVTLLFLAGNLERIKADECHLTPVIHKLQYPGCQEKRIPSYACVGRCTSYVKVRICEAMQSLRLITFWPISGVWIKDLANGEIMHVLSGKRRTRGRGVIGLSKC